MRRSPGLFIHPRFRSSKIQIPEKHSPKRSLGIHPNLAGAEWNWKIQPIPEESRILGADFEI